MANLSVRTRLFLTIGVLATLLVVVGLIGLRALSQSNADLQAGYHHNLLPITWVSEMTANSREAITALDEAIVSGDPADLASYQALVKSMAARNNELWTIYRAMQLPADEKALADECERTRKEYRETRDTIIKALVAGSIEEARRGRGTQLKARITAMTDAAERLQEFKVKHAEQAASEANASHSAARLKSVMSILVGIGLASILGWLLVRSMLQALRTAIGISERIAAGELGQPIEIASHDEFGRLLTALRDMDHRLSAIVASVRSGADAVGTAARQISGGNDDLSQRTQEQASALEETAASMEEMTATVKQNADNARQASELASDARTEADRGGDIVGRAVGAMTAINDASGRIANIIQVIEEIAFQTNLLALNAAVEAARAGEQGRSFAVVASEVRSLAQRSSTAAKEIRGLISDSVEKVKVGTELVDESGRSLNDIVASVKKVADVVAEISLASGEQASGIDQVNNAVSQMDSVTQQNAALVEQAAAASKSMEHQASALIEKISFFRIRQQQLRVAGVETSSHAEPAAPVAAHASPVSSSHRSRAA